MPDSTNPRAPSILFPLRLELCHERTRTGRSAKICWSPDVCQVAPRSAGADLEHYASTGDPYPALPDRVRLYTMDAAGAVQLLVEPGPIDHARVKLQLPRTGGELPGASWLWDFEIAVACGMATVVSGARFDQLAAARWLIAVGCREDTRNDVAGLLASHHARGRLQVLHQGQCTNDGERSAGGDAGRDPCEPGRNGELLARGLRGTGALWREVPGAELDEHDVVRDVHAVLWDGCLAHLRHDPAYEAWRALFVDHVRGRGWLPALAIGAQPYGIVVAMASGGLGREGLLQAISAPGGAAELRARLLGLALGHRRTIHRHAGDLAASHARWEQSGAAPPFSAYAGRVGEVLGDPGETVLARLLRVLGHSATSSRCDAVIVAPGPTGTATVEHALIVGELGPGDYAALAEDKSALDLTTLPLLLRLVVLSELATPEPARPAFRARAVALYGRYRDRPEELRQLMLETIDCLSYRLDAWVTGAAVQRLAELQPADADQPDGHGIGAFGWLEQPIGQLDPPASPEYFQAPSLNHAQTLAILRAGSATTQAAYRVDLSAPRAAYAMSVFRDASAGVDPAELLGLHARAVFRAKNEERILLALRGLPPFGVGVGDGAHRIDGLAFTACDFAEPAANSPERKAIVDAIQARLSAADYRAVVDVWREVRCGRDAIADVAIAEAVHQYNLGNLAAVTGWFEAAQGRAIPGLPDVLRTPLRSRNVPQRMVLLVRHREPPASPAGGAEASAATLRPIGEPGLAALCEQLIAVPSAVTLDVSVAGVRATRTLVVASRAGAGLIVSALDLVLGGRAELDRRLRLWITRDLVDNAAAYGPPLATAPPDRRLVLAATAEISRRDADDGWAHAFTASAAFAALLGNGRPLHARDLRLAEPRASGAVEAQQRDAEIQLDAARDAVAALRALHRRVQPTLAVLDDLRAAATAARDPGGYLAVAERAVALGELDLLDGADTAAGIDGSLGRWLDERRAAILALIRGRTQAVARFEHEAKETLEDGTVVTVRLDPDAPPASPIDVACPGASVMAVRIDRAAPVPPPEVVDRIVIAAERLVAGLSAALAACCGTDRASVLPPVRWTPPPLREGDDHVLQLLGRVRAPMRTMSELRATGAIDYRYAAARRTGDDQLVAQLRSWAQQAGRDGAAQLTLDDLANLDALAAAPTALHVFGPTGLLATMTEQEAIAGLVVDEWIEPTTPDAHDTAVAFHQPGPPTEAPNAILIGVPRGDAWGPHELAEAIAATIDLMRIRTLSCDELLGDDAVGATFPAVQLPAGALVRTTRLEQDNP